jgi:hypothetical protein
MTQTSVQSPKSISLAQIHIKEPCRADWETMAGEPGKPGDNSKRFCAQCEKHVHNLDALTQNQIDALFEEHQGKLCIRYTPPAARITTAPVAPPKPIHRRPLLSTLSRFAAALLLASSVGLTGCGSSSTPASYSSLTPIERFNDWRSANAYSWVNSLLDPFFGTTLYATTGAVAYPAPVALGGAMSIQGDVAVKGEVACPPPATQPADPPATQPAPELPQLMGKPVQPPTTQPQPFTTVGLTG